MDSIKINKKVSSLASVLLLATWSGDALAQNDLLSARCDAAARMAFVSGDVAAAEQACQEAIRAGEKEDPPGERVAYPLMKLGALYMMMGLQEPELKRTDTNLAAVAHAWNDKALGFFERALTVREAARGPDDPSVGKVLESMASILALQGRNGEAEALHQRLIKIYESSYGAESRELAWALRGYAVLLKEMGREAEAADLRARADAILGE